MSTLRPRAAALVLVLALPFAAGCWGGGPRKPLFGGEDPPTAAEPPSAPTPRQRQQDTPEAVLLRDLRRAGTDGERRALAEELVKRGPAARDLVLKARDEEGLLVDLLDDVLRRIDAAADPPTPERRAIDAEWVKEKYALALDRHLAGDSWGALRLIDAILALEPGTDQRARLLRLQRRARDRIFRESVLVADLVPGATAIVPSQPLLVRVRLTNVSRSTITLRVTNRTLGAISVAFEELSHDGRRTRTRTERPVPAPPELRLEPGQSIELPVEMPSPHADLDALAVGRFHLGGRLRAHTLLVGDVPYPFYVPLLPAEVLVVQPRDLEMARDARAAFHAAVAAGQQTKGEPQRQAAHRAFVAALLVARDDAEGALALVAEALEAHGSRGAVEDALCAALARITGEPLGFSRAEWLQWWQRQRSRPERLREEREARAEDEALGQDDDAPRDEQKGARHRSRRR